MPGCRPFRTAGGYVMPSFPGRRVDAVERELRWTYP